MQRTRWSKILQSDYGGIPDRAPGMPILQSHGNLVSRGDLITQDNISIPDVFTITINKDTFSQLCTVGDPGQLIDYTLFNIGGTFAIDQNGIYADSFGSGSGYHGPVAYMQLPQNVGNMNKYWYTLVKYDITNSQADMASFFQIRIGFSISINYDDTNASSISGKRFLNFINSSTFANVYNNKNIQSVSDTIKIYHYTNNTMKVYLNDSLVFNGQDPLPLNKSNNVVTILHAQNGTYRTLNERLKQITISTDPTYDPQP